ncbi:uncharacterized protein [Montipora capricornis]|uniref:uncharacterized protein n=1 Tax=Montipora foliosa TaxID=591990 RepID=UPI0035F1A04B
MKYFLGIFILALLAGIRAQDFDDLFLHDEANEKPAGDRADDFEADLLWNDEATVEGLPKRQPFVQCNIDIYKCIQAGNVSKNECLKKYLNCMEQLSPTKLPPILENFVQCKKSLYKCILDSNKTKMECLREYKACMAELLPSKPPQFLQCKIDLYKCLIEADNASMKNCMDEYKDCMRQLMPSKLPPFVQCKVDMYNCFKTGKPKKECFDEYKACMAPLIPTVPPFMRACKDELKKCVDSKSTLLAKAKCYIAFAKCLKNKGPSEVVLDAIEDASQMENGSLAQCKDDLKNCLLEGKDRNECLQDFKACAAAQIPPYMKKCINDGKECVNGASNVIQRIICLKKVAICLKKGKESQASI